MSSQKKKEQKRKRRENVRQQHLAKRRERPHDWFIKRHIESLKEETPILPHKNNRVGWHRQNILTIKSILKKAYAKYPHDSALRTLLLNHPVPEYRVHHVNSILTEVAREISCYPPYFIPRVEMTDAGISVFKIEMDKIATPHGAAWFYSCGMSNVVSYDRKIYRLAFSTHAIDRFLERIVVVDPMKVVDDVYAMFYGLATLKIYDKLIPLTLDNINPIGYMPFEIQKNFIIGTTILIPGMRETPEYYVLKKVGYEFEKINTVNDLDIPEIKDVFIKCGLRES